MRDLNPGEADRDRLVPTKIQCPACGYNLTGATIGTTCPECGTMVGQGLVAEHTLPTSLRAVLALLLGVLSVMGWWSWGAWCFLAGPVAVQLALQAKVKAARGEISAASGGVAQVGLVCGFIGTAFGVVTVLVVTWWLMFG